MLRQGQQPGPERAADGKDATALCVLTFGLTNFIGRGEDHHVIHIYIELVRRTWPT